MGMPHQYVRQSLEFLAAVTSARRVGGRVEQDRSRGGRHGSSNTIDIDGERWCGIDGHTAAPHMADMETLGGRIMAARNNDKWYDKPLKLKVLPKVIGNYVINESTVNLLIPHPHSLSLYLFLDDRNYKNKPKVCLTPSEIRTTRQAANNVTIAVLD